ncbi:GNAT family N-acetyltransferase [Nocardioides sp. KIGAM211]|uniref:GNAT family N-acetyltransferase n=1 Tax=Nocardioides luti TaxID=2761101 RepID=A0A7X0RIJ2_9ACTN|nr:GNAT family N-acetyltransferase [Nocardioides luti]
MREVGVEELVATTDDPFLRHHPLRARRAWRSGAAVVLDGAGGRPGAPPGRVFTALGPPDLLGPLMHDLAAAGEQPLRLTVDVTAYDVVPAAWHQPAPHRWHWMLTRGPAPEAAASVEEVTDPAEIDAVLDVANPDSFARPGTPGVECWLGLREAGALVAVGALVRQPDGSGHLRGVSVLPAYAGRGLGTALSAALTRRGLAGPGVCSLGVYVDNAPAVAIYGRLGYVAAHTFASGTVSA